GREGGVPVRGRLARKCGGVLGEIAQGEARRFQQPQADVAEPGGAVRFQEIAGHSHSKAMPHGPLRMNSLFSHDLGYCYAAQGRSSTPPFRCGDSVKSAASLFVWRSRAVE